MGYLHIDGRGMKPNGGSRHNPLEAETIAAWLVAHKDDIERHYGEPLYKVVGVVTPFSAQVNAIKMSLRKLEINGKDELPACSSLQIPRHVKECRQHLPPIRWKKQSADTTG